MKNAIAEAQNTSMSSKIAFNYMPTPWNTSTTKIQI